MKLVKEYKYLFVLLILFIVYNSFFINKALHIDDPSTMSMAKAVNINPLKPDHSFFGNPLFLGYYYAPIMRIFDEREIWLHIFYFPFPLLVLASMFFLSLRFANKSLFPVLFLISSSSFIISSQSIMLDIPLLGFFLASVTAFIYGIDRDNDFLLVLSGLFTAIAILTKYSGIMLIPILYIYARLNSGKKKIRFLLIPILVFLLWNGYSMLVYKESPFIFSCLWRLYFYFLNGIKMRFFASLSFLSGTSIIVLFLIPFLLRKRGNLLYFLLSFLSGLIPFTIKGDFKGYSFFEKSFLAILFIAGSYIILFVLKSGFKAIFKKDNKDTLFLSIWFLLIFIFNMLANFIAGRFLLLLLPPLFLLIYNELSSYNFEIIKTKVKFIVLVSIIFSTILAIGDYRCAGLYRDFVHSFKEKAYFFSGSYYDSWGYGYYVQKYHRSIKKYEIREKLKQRDGIFVTPTELVLPIVIERASAFNKILDLDYDRVLIDSIYYKGNMLLHNRKFHTGFYCHDWGLLPFYLSMQKVPIECFEIWLLKKKRIKI